MNTLNKRLKEYRINQKITQKELSDLSGISVLTINKLENGHDGKISTFESLFAALGYPNIFENVLPSIEDRPSYKFMKINNHEIKRVRKKQKNSNWSWGK